MRKEDSALIVAKALRAAKGALVKRWELEVRTGLSESQVTYGIEYLRDVLAGRDDVMFVSQKGPFGGVGLTTDPLRVRRYVKGHAHTAHVQARRVLTGSVESLVNTTTGAELQQAELVKLNLERLVADLERLSQ